LSLKYLRLKVRTKGLRPNWNVGIMGFGKMGQWFIVKISVTVHGFWVQRFCVHLKSELLIREL